MTLATTGSGLQRLNEALAYSESNRKSATRRRAQIRERVAHELGYRNWVHDLDPDDVAASKIEATTDMQASSDAVWKGAVANERWGAQLAELYAKLVLVEQNEQLIRQNELLVRQGERTHALLVELIAVAGDLPTALADHLHNARS